jgi:uncharacterized membrane protein YdjX (TVP38/TMEM64 family)
VSLAPKKTSWFWGILLLATVALLIYQVRSLIVPALGAVEGLVYQAGAFGPILMVLATGIWITLLLPGPLILGLSGTLFADHPLVAIAVSSLGIALAQATAFILARSFMRQAVLDKVGHKPWFRWLSQKVEEKGAKGVLVIRLLPGFPNTLANYGFGVTKIKFWPYLLASWLGTLPLITVFILGAAEFIQILREH